MEKYTPPLKINFLVKFFLFVASCFLLSPLFLFGSGGSIVIHGLEYKTPDTYWLAVIGATSLFLIGFAAALVLKNIKFSLSYLGAALATTLISTVIHPAFVLQEFIITFIIILLISSILISYDLKFRNSK